MISNRSMNLGASLPCTLKHHKPLRGDTLRHTKFPTLKLISLRLWSAQLFYLDCAIRRFSLTIWTYFGASFDILGPKFFVLQSHSRTTGFSTYDHISSRTMPSLNSLDRYCYRRNSTYGRFLSELISYYRAQTLNISSRIWFTLLICPSVWGW
jgi:hypothetical protein